MNYTDSRISYDQTVVCRMKPIWQKEGISMYLNSMRRNWSVKPLYGNTNMREVDKKSRAEPWNGRGPWRKQRVRPHATSLIKTTKVFDSGCDGFVHCSDMGIEHIQKPNSWTYNFVQVSGHNLESSQTGGFRVQFLQYKRVSNSFCSGGGGVKYVSTGDFE